MNKEKKKIQDNRICGQGNDVQMNRKYAGACYKNGVESKLLADKYLSSASTLVHGSGTVQVKKDGSTDSWDECQVWIKLEDNTDSWVEAEGIFVKATDNTDEWTEIQ